MLKFVFSLWIGLLLLALAGQVQAETRYVSDQLVLTLRSAPGNGGEIITHLRTDDGVEILEEQGDYARVRTTKGEEGFVQKHYLSKSPPKTETIARLEREVEQLQTRLNKYQSGAVGTEQELVELRSQRETLETDLNKTRQQLSAIQAKYDKLLADSGDLANIIQERDQLQQTNQELQNAQAGLEEENSRLLVNAIIKWFLAGGGVFFLGWAMGKISRKKRRPF